MQTLALDVYLDSRMGMPTDLPHAGSSLEHPLVFDLAAREFKQWASMGLVEILSERQRPAWGEMVFDQLSFKRLR
ncbi:hypothetical protein [Roseateles sp.]|uniref:hypothetical protein n=1 Tax=Roseateles sp. TaxID=1971397 RepID=UPI003BA83C38